MQMTPESWRRVKELVDACLDLDPADRPAYLDRACAGEDELRQEAESLLASHDEAGEFLERPALSAPESGMRLGPWLLETEVGAGGMGRIYRAGRADGQYQQKVAVKLLRRGMDTDSILSHFQSERQILASLNHPNVARLLDGGVTPDGRPFFVMEFIDGKPMDKWVDDSNPPLNARLRMFQQICDAVQYAHQRLVVHRDIKPANILVTADGVPKLVDFGIAKLIGPGPADITVAAERLLTPAYASPEQIAGAEVTTASDVYSLGLILRRLAGGRKDDLDTIIEKALEQDPARRYGSAAQLSDDIQRYLDGHPVVARKPTIPYRVARFVRRNRVLVGAAALVMLALSGGLAATYWQYRIAQFERQRAEARFAKLRQLANSVINEFHEAIVDIPGTTEARALMLTRAVAYLDGLSAEAGNDRALRLELGSAYMRVGDVQGRTGVANLGLRAESAKSYNKAIAIVEGVPGGEAVLARVLMHAGGEQNTRRAVDLAEKAGLREILADAYFAHADELLERGDWNGAIELRRKDLAIRKELLDKDPKNRRLRVNYALVSKRLGGLLIRTGKLDEAYTRYTEARDMEKAVLAEDPLSLEAQTALSYSTSDIGHIRMEQGRNAEALEYYREAVKLRERLFAADEKNYRTRVALTSACRRTGDLLVSMGRATEAIDWLHRAEQLLTGPGAPPIESASQREELAIIHFSTARAQGARGRPMLERARTEFARLSQEVPGREDLRERLRTIDEMLAK